MGNIRWETRDEQSRNRALQINNRTGVSGVALHEKTSSKGDPVSYFVATVNIPKELSDSDKEVKIQKSFSLHKYGEEKALLLAAAWRKEKFLWLSERGVVYAESHGKIKASTEELSKS